MKKVPRLGPKAYEQAVGFLRIIDGTNPFDGTDIHPESYDVAKAILKKANAEKLALGSPELEEALKGLNGKELKEEFGIGQETLELVLDGLLKPGRDPREEVAGPILRSDVLKMEDLQVGMELEGTVRNVVKFGAFVDIGLKNDALLHISEISNKYIDDPSKVLAVGQIIKVRIKDVDKDRGRVGLTKKEQN